MKIKGVLYLAYVKFTSQWLLSKSGYLLNTSTFFKHKHKPCDSQNHQKKLKIIKMRWVKKMSCRFLGII